jgi:hypothetical protein
MASKRATKKLEKAQKLQPTKTLSGAGKPKWTPFSIEK